MYEEVPVYLLIKADEFQDAMERWVELFNRVTAWNPKATLSCCILGHFVPNCLLKDLHGKVYMLDTTVLYIQYPDSGELHSENCIRILRGDPLCIR